MRKFLRCLHGAWRGNELRCVGVRCALKPQQPTLLLYLTYHKPGPSQSSLRQGPRTCPSSLHQSLTTATLPSRALSRLTSPNSALVATASFPHERISAVVLLRTDYPAYPRDCTASMALLRKTCFQRDLRRASM
jgi:hypothetical protein